MVDFLGGYLTLGFLFDEERVMGSQHNGTNPIHRSSGHPPGARSVNREDANVMRPPRPTTPSTFQVTYFSWFGKMIGKVPINMQASPFILSQNTLKGDD